MNMIRCELHNTHDYTALHHALAARGVSRYVLGGTGTLFRLPTGTYVTKVNATATQVRDLVKLVARSIGHPDASVLVSGAADLAWDGLTPATWSEIFSYNTGAA